MSIYSFHPKPEGEGIAKIEQGQGKLSFEEEGYMFTKICIFVHDNLYNSKRHFTLKFAEALTRQGVDVRIIDTKEGALEKEELVSVYRFNPDLTCSFNSMLPLADGTFLWDAFEIPHLSILLDPAIYALNLTKSSYALASYVDRHDEKLLSSTGFKTHFFLPHAVERELLDESLEEEKTYDVVLLGSCYDHESVRAAWKQEFPKKISQALDDVIDLSLGDPRLSPLEALIHVWNEKGIDFPQGNYQHLYSYVDRYMRGKDRFELVQAITDVPVHIFGDIFWESGVSLKGWKHYLSKQINVHVHKPVPFETAIKVLRKSRLALNSTPFFKDGSHERFFYALATGCSVLASENGYAREIFKEGQGVFYYPFIDKSNVGEEVKALLGDEALRQEQVVKGRQIIRKGHTWDHRAKAVQEAFPALLAEVYSRTMSCN